MSKRMNRFAPFACGFVCAFVLFWVGGTDFNERGFWTAYSLAMCILSGALTQALAGTIRHD